MTAPSKIWLVTSGDYSAYGVHFACPSLEEAALAAAKLNSIESYRGYEVQEFELVTADQIIFETTLRLSWAPEPVYSRPAGDDLSTSVEWHLEPQKLYVKWGYNPERCPDCDGKYAYPRQVLVWGNDHERVRKVFGELKAQAMEDGPWAQEAHEGEWREP